MYYTGVARILSGYARKQFSVQLITVVVADNDVTVGGRANTLQRDAVIGCNFLLMNNT